MRRNSMRQQYLGTTRTYPNEYGRMAALYGFMTLILTLAFGAPWIRPLMDWLLDG